MLDVSKPALSKHISVLADAGYIAQRRAVRATRQRVWLSLTESGRAAYRRQRVWLSLTESGRAAYRRQRVWLSLTESG
ncbi:MAG TPA: transcriptional regulator, partial [Streptosporangiaceae bacterium]|nr:transcriptional regulator [Streptosporangiaceae bacterium]